MAFWVFFVGWYLAATERAGNASAGATQLVFKQNARIPSLHEHLDKDDTETGSNTNQVPSTENDHQEAQDDQTTLLKPRPVFSWYHMNYDVTIAKGHQRRLLNDISGYVAPGKMVSATTLVDICVTD